MMTDNSDSISQENNEQSVQSESQDSVQNNDINDVLEREKSYSQKQRKRAQIAEAELEKIRARQAKLEEESLAEQNKFKELWEKDKDDAAWARDYKKTRHTSLLERIPEEKREKFNNLGIDQLEAVVEEFYKPESKEPMKKVPGQVDVKLPDKSYAEMTDSERRAYHTSVVEKSIKR